MGSLECTNSKCSIFKYIALFFLSAGIFILLYFYVDKHVAEYFSKLNITVFSSVFSLMGKGLLWVVFFWSIVLIFWRQRHTSKTIKWVFASGLWLSICYIICSFLKIIAGRARPTLWIHDNIFGFYGPKFHEPYLSFPSGHTTTFMALALALGVFLPRYRIYLILFGLALSCTRIIFVDHYCSDVFGTTVLILLLFFILKQRIFKE